ncbi:hypothetical protein GCM10027299_06100 [Larkinella ripae]
MSAYVLGFQEINKATWGLVGGKGANLGELSGIKGIRVPEGFCVTTEAYKKITKNRPELEELLEELTRLRPEEREAIGAISARIRAIIEKIAIPAELADEIAVQRYGGRPADGFLRRSAGHLPERDRKASHSKPHQPVLGVAVHGSGGHLPPSKPLRPPECPPGGGGAEDGFSAGGWHFVYGRPRYVQPERTVHRRRFWPG